MFRLARRRRCTAPEIANARLATRPHRLRRQRPRNRHPQGPRLRHSHLSGGSERLRRGHARTTARRPRPVQNRSDVCWSPAAPAPKSTTSTTVHSLSASCRANTATRASPKSRRPPISPGSARPGRPDPLRFHPRKSERSHLQGNRRSHPYRGRPLPPRRPEFFAAKPVRKRPSPSIAPSTTSVRTSGFTWAPQPSTQGSPESPASSSR
jgi:hypothetical protein